MKCFAAHHPSIEQSVEAVTGTVGVLNSKLQHFSSSQLMMNAGSGGVLGRGNRGTQRGFGSAPSCVWSPDSTFMCSLKKTSQLTNYSHLRIYQCSFVQSCNLKIISSFIMLEMNFTVRIRGVIVLKLRLKQ